MNARKRQAPEELLPLRYSKQARRTRVRFTGEHASPSQQEGILSRWIQLANELYTLSFETLGHFLPVVSKTTSIVPPPPPPPPRTSTVPLPLPPRAAPLRSILSRPSTAKPEPLARPPSAGPSNASTEFESAPSAAPPPAVAPASTVAPSEESSEDYRVLYPEITAALRASERRKSGTENRKRIPSREHIFAKNYRTQVMVERQKQREQMTKELYTMRRMTGYGSDFQTFQNYLNYRARLELLERREALSPSPSLTDLRAKSQVQKKERRYSTSDYVKTDFLARSLEKARETLNSPRPPKPFIPTFEQLRLSTRTKDEAIERTLRPKRPPLPASLPPEDEAQVAAFLANRSFSVKLDRERVEAKDLQRLRPCQWLNDEIINFYGALVMSRCETEKENKAKEPKAKKLGRPGSQLLNVHYFNSFFWAKLSGSGYTKGRLDKWTKNFDVFSKDLIIMAVNHSNSHWTAAAINFRRKRFESFDSMGFSREVVFKHLRDFLDAEHRHRKNQPFDFTGWENYTLPTTPQQENGYDCGVFTCQFMESLSRGEETFNFTQENMPYLRRRMIWEIGNTKLRDD